MHCHDFQYCTPLTIEHQQQIKQDLSNTYFVALPRLARSSGVQPSAFLSCRIWYPQCSSSRQHIQPLPVSAAKCITVLPCASRLNTSVLCDHKSRWHSNILLICQVRLQQCDRQLTIRCCHLLFTRKASVLRHSVGWAPESHPACKKVCYSVCWWRYDCSFARLHSSHCHHHLHHP